jgi:hypothetical protein
LVAIFALPALIMIFCYSIVIRELWRSNKNMALLTNNSSTARQDHSQIEFLGVNIEKRKKDRKKKKVQIWLTLPEVLVPPPRVQFN